MTWLGAKEEEALDGHLLALGRRKADERIVHFALYLFHRGGQTGLSRKNTLEIPVKQSQLADSLDISLIHTNKTLQSLRKRRLRAEERRVGKDGVGTRSSRWETYNEKTNNKGTTISAGK